jgi:cytochrome P450
MFYPKPPEVKSGFLGRRFRLNPIEFLCQLSKKGDITTFKVANQRVFFLNHPDLVRDVLVTNAHKFIKGRALQKAKKVLGEGLLTSEGSFHLRQRRMIQPAFHRQRINQYAEVMIQYGERFSNKWHEDDVPDIDKEMMRLTLQIVAKTLFNADVEDEADEVGKALTALVETFQYLLLPFVDTLEKLPLPQSLRFRKAKNSLDQLIYRIIQERRESGEDKGDLLSMLLVAQDEEDNSTMTDEQVRNEALTLFLAGHETTANALTFSWYLLSQHPEKEAKLVDELNQVLKGRLPVPEDYHKLRYTEAILAESMRLYPPAWALGRLAIEDHEISGYKIPRGSLVLVSMYVAHRDERFWQKPNEFIPERWEKISIKEASNKYIYFPFGCGVRRCIGENFAWTEGVLLLATIARKWKLQLEPSQKFAIKPMITLRPRYGMKMRLQKRT